MGIMLSRHEVGQAAWNDYCDRHPGAWWWHRWEWLEYQMARGLYAGDGSGCVLGKEGIETLVVALIDKNTGVISIEGHPGPCILGRDLDLANPTEAETENVNALSKTVGVKGVTMRSETFSGHFRKYNPDLFRAWSWQTQIVDLRPATLDLWAGVRKSYHALINHVEKTHEIVVDERGKLMEAFRQVHAHEAGRETRPRATWEMMADWCKTGNGLHVCALLGGVVVACVYFEVYKGCAYYGHAAAYHKNLTHALIWRGMQELKARGVTLLEMGWLDYPGEEGRAVFKTGFGGEARTIYAVERTWA